MMQAMQVAVRERPVSARAAFLEADYDLCVSLLSDERSPAGDLLLARALLRMRRFSDAEDVIRRSPARRSATGLTLLGVARARQGDSTAANERFAAAQAVARTPNEHAEVNYRCAQAAFLLNDFHQSIEYLDRIESDSSSFGVAQEVRAWMQIRRGAHRDALEYLHSAAMHANGDRYLEANVLMAAAMIAREIYSPETMRRVEHYLLHRSVTPYTATQRFHILRAAAWFAAMGNSYASALELLRDADRLDSRPTSTLASLCDRAYFALSFGEEHSGWDCAERALTIVRSIDWTEISRDEPLGLLYLIGLLAERKPLEARRLWKIYETAIPRDPLSEWANDIRTQAWVAFTLGLLARAEGNKKAALTQLSRAFSLYRRIGFEWRAILCLLARGWSPLTESEYAAYVSDTLERFPNSWLRTQVERRMNIQAATPLAMFTPMQREVLAAVLLGKTNPQIAAELGRAERTVRDHVSEILHRTGCKTRVALVRYCHDNAITL